MVFPPQFWGPECNSFSAVPISRRPPPHPPHLTSCRRSPQSWSRGERKETVTGLEGQRSQVRQGGGEGASLRRLPGQGWRGLTPARERAGRGQAGGGGEFGGWVYFIVSGLQRWAGDTLSRGRQKTRSRGVLPRWEGVSPPGLGIPLAEGSGQSGPGKGGESAKWQDLPPTLRD